MGHQTLPASIPRNSIHCRCFAATGPAVVAMPTYRIAPNGTTRAFDEQPELSVKVNCSTSTFVCRPLPLKKGREMDFVWMARCLVGEMLLLGKESRPFYLGFFFIFERFRSIQRCSSIRWKGSFFYLWDWKVDSFFRKLYVLENWARMEPLMIWTTHRFEILEKWSGNT